MLNSIDPAAFQGASASGTIPLTEKVLNELANASLAERPGRIQQFEIQIGRDNYLQAGVNVRVGPFSKWFRPELAVAPSMQRNRVVISVVSPQYAGLLWIADLLIRERLPKGLSVQGRDLIVDVAALSGIARYAGYLHSLQIRTERGVLLLSFEARVDK
jgi:hypothetical protein